MKLFPFVSFVALAAASLLSFVGSASAQKPAAAAPPVSVSTSQGAGLSAQTRDQIFETVWKRVNDNYYDPTFGGVNWKNVHDTYAPLVEKPQTDAAFYGVLQKMLGELKRSHFAIIPPAAYETEARANALTKPDKTPAKETNPAPKTPKTPDTPAIPKAEPDAAGEARDGEAGFEIRMVENQPVVWKVVKGSGADQAGLKPGYLVTSLKGRLLAPIVEAVSKSLGQNTEARLYVRRAIAQGLQGPVGEKMVVDVLDENDDKKSFVIPYDAPQGTLTKFAGLPPVYVENESRILDNNIGYIRFNIFLFPVVPKIQAAIADMQSKNVKGIIIDLRNNPGGVGSLTQPIAGVLFTRQTDLGAMQMRNGVTRFPVFPRPNPYTGPLVVLTDEGSASTSEILAGSLQELGRATVVGQKTAGAVLPSYIENLPGTRARLQYAFGDFKTPKGTLLEGRGVLPDIPVPLTRQAFFKTSDPELAAAVDYLKTFKKDK